MRLILTATVATVALLGCDAATIQHGGERTAPWLVDGGVPMEMDAAAPASEEPAELFARTVQPLLEDSCVACHSGGDTLGFFGAPMYESVIGSPRIIDRSNPMLSPLVSKGLAGGHASLPRWWGSEEQGLIVDWINAEMGSDPGEVIGRDRETLPIAVERITTVPLAGSAEGIEDGVIVFEARFLGEGVYLEGIRVVAGEDAGLRVKHPQIARMVGDRVLLDPADQYSGLELLVPRGGSMELGSILLPEFAPTDRLIFVFEGLSSYDGTGGGGTPTGPEPGEPGEPGEPDPTGCQSVDSYLTNAVPALVNNCTRCHGGGNPTATAALNMQRVGSMDEDDQQRACNQVLARSNLMDINSSAILQVPDPLSGLTHPFKLSGATRDDYRDALRLWLTEEAER